MSKTRVLFVCMGNICRSPLAHGRFQELVKEAGLEHLIEVDSAGTHAYHVGNAPDPRSQETARKRGFEIRDQRARQVGPGDLEAFDYILAMDSDNLAILKDMCPPGHEEKVSLFLEFAPHLEETEVPDPYYGGRSGFDRVYDLVDAASAGLLAAIRERHNGARERMG